MPNTWTPEQNAAIETRDKTLLISAAAGSGKTAVLTERIIRLLTDRENPASLERMLIVTFSRAAAAELRQRIRSIQRQPLWHHQIFHCVDAHFHIIRHRQRQGDGSQPTGHRNASPCSSPLPQPQDHQTGQR